MTKESEIQSWIVQLTDNRQNFVVSDLYSVLRYEKSSLGQEMKCEVEQYGRVAGLSRFRHRSAREACRVLKSLFEPRFKSANINISNVTGMVLKPDLVLEDEISGAFIIVELKRSKKAAREFGTELLAYTNCLSQQHPGSQVFLVLISTSLAPLEKHAIAELAHRHIPVLVLEYRDPDVEECTPTLLVRSDLLPSASVQTFPETALSVDTKVFFLPPNWDLREHICCLHNHVEHAIVGLVREAERGRASGFVIVWYLLDEVQRYLAHGLETRLFVSMAIRNPCRPQEFPVFKTAKEREQFARSNTFTELTDDTAVRLLRTLEIGENFDSYSSESEGTWANFQARLESDSAHILRFDSFGEIGDHVNRWRTEKRYTLRPVISDTTSFSAWHPLTWLPALESLIDSSDQEDGDPLAWHAFQRGKDLNEFRRRSHRRGVNDRHFGRAAADAHFARTWCDFIEHRDAPKLRTSVVKMALRCHVDDFDLAVEFASDIVAEEGKLASYCFALGAHVSSRCNNVEYLVKQRKQLRRENIFLPKKLDRLVDDIAIENGYDIISSTLDGAQ
ncbi:MULTISPECIES: hypothetical protein [unclassified Janthinobacterium]|uniref:hypothetical protein n=1 Tax=unclassified Janthinobacterium TaxID=2610881 RepID=UPI0016206B08|nr:MULTISPECIES: hypothetical protein [unclassified Janthinobacterium]MBB5369330.1 hypothetical protein [Janthinobacterium sp. K2C7]MBB5381134.1 hypothetical protein [Janthinobacterium sp. K2Li3]MBB5387713.1 hypothetical protein [Janthinobacterium sp. K2E3]